VKIEIEAVLDGRPVDLRDETAGAGQLGAIEANALA
jgi:hypothetical protein